MVQTDEQQKKKVKYTKQQQTAIDARDSSVIVSAAAGSGKTAVLTDRIVKLLSDPISEVDADRIIIVTFTNDAAAEMKKRISNKLADLINENPDNKHLIKQQALLQNARISTINSFCVDFLRDNITNQGITSGFEIMDESADNVLKAQAMEELFDWYSTDDRYNDISYLYDRFCIKNHKKLEYVIMSVEKFISSVPMPDDWLAMAVTESCKNFMDSIYGIKLFGYAYKKAVNILNGFQENSKLIPDIFYNDMSSKPAVAHMEQAFDDIEVAGSFLKVIESETIPTDTKLNYVDNIKSLKQIRDKTPYNEALRKVYQDRRTSLKNELKELCSFFDMTEDNFKDAQKVIKILVEVVRKYREIIWEKKCSKNAISFNDSESLVLKILAVTDESGHIIQSEVARSMSEYYSCIMIDEYQDSNNKQDLIFKLLSKNYKIDSDGTSAYGGNVFLVGDVKQCIYRFRLANPDNFIKAMKKAVPYNKETDSVMKLILLNKNFRSSEETIDFINFVFGGIMSEECGEIDYNDDEKLYFGAKKYTNADVDCKPCIMLINTDSDSESDDNASDDEKNIEAEVTAEKIAEMIKTKVQVAESDGSTRNCRPSDFLILARTNAASKDYVQALEKRNIPAVGNDEKGYLKSQEIVTLIDLLRIIANPLKEVPMSVVMLSPMYMFSLEELSYIKSLDRKKQLYQILISIVNGEYEGFDVRLLVKCKEFLESIDRFRLDSVTMTLSELINSIYDMTDFISVMQINKDGDKKRANLRMLIRYAQSYEKFAAADSNGGLGGFISYIDRISEIGDYEQGKVSSSSGDYVTIKTLHKSKGLEYPFVFICETQKDFQLKDYDKEKDSYIKRNTSVICSDDGRIGFILGDKELFRRYKTFQYTMLENEKKLYTISEEMRLLYVGMTRTQQKLFINLRCGFPYVKEVKNLMNKYTANGGDIKHIAFEAKRFSDWIWLCLMTNSGFGEISELLGLDSCVSGIYSSELFEYRYYDSSKTNEGFAVQKHVILQPDENAVKNIMDIIDNYYDRTLSETTAKLSVTQISRKFSETEEYDFHLKRPAFISERRTLTGAERGTAIHTFFQYCNFEKAAEDAGAEVERLTLDGHLTKAQAECISYNKICAFFASSLYKRIQSAGNYEREKKFMVLSSELKTNNPEFEKLKNSDNMIKGIIDLMFEESDGIVIVDYKSDRGLDDDALRERYKTQLEIYKSAIEMLTGKKVKELLLYSIELRREILL